MESPPSRNGDVFNFQTEEKAQQDAPDAPEEPATRALTDYWLQECGPRTKASDDPRRAWHFL